MRFIAVLLVLIHAGVFCAPGLSVISMRSNNKIDALQWRYLNLP